jgi:hypothetical protein
MTAPSNDLPWLGRRADNKLLRGQVLPRARELLLDKQWFGVIPVAIAFCAAFSSSLAKDLVINDVALAQVSVASLSFGACVTGTVLSLTLSAERARAWATTRRNPTARFSNLSDLVFVFIWSAFCQLAVVFAAFAAIAVGGHRLIYVPNPGLGERVLLFADVLVTTYAFFQLVSVLRTLLQIGVVNIATYSGEHQANREQSEERTDSSAEHSR